MKLGALRDILRFLFLDYGLRVPKSNYYLFFDSSTKFNLYWLALKTGCILLQVCLIMPCTNKCDIEMKTTASLCKVALSISCCFAEETSENYSEVFSIPNKSPELR
jgi:hypothetical protein